MRSAERRVRANAGRKRGSSKHSWRSIFRIELVALLVSSILAVSLAVFGFWLAAFIDANGIARAEHLQCTNSVLSLRESLISLRRGYEVDKADRPNRMADWEQVRFSLDQLTYTCKSSLQDEVELSMAYGQVRADLKGELDLAYQGHWETTNVDMSIEWTGSALKYLSAG